MIRQLAVSTLIVSGLIIGGCSSSSSSSDPVAVTPGVGNSVYDNIFNDPDLSTLLAAIDAAGLDTTLDDEASQFTVFAPNNAAFEALENSQPDVDVIAGLIADPDTLSPILTYHVLSGTTDAAGATAATADGPVELPTVNGADVRLSRSDTSATGLSVGSAAVLIGDSNYDPATSVGVVHVISAVLTPPVAEETE